MAESPSEVIDINKGLVDITSGIQNISVSYSQEQTRANIAKIFTYVFLLLVAIAMTGPLIGNVIRPGTFSDPIDSAKTLLTVLASVLAGPFGFIVGFYFKQVESTTNQS